MNDISPRMARVQDLLYRELANLIKNELHDPRIGLVTISGIKVSKDLSYAKAYFSVFESEKNENKIEETRKVLNNSSGFLRSRLAKRVSLNTVPKLKFFFDESISEGIKIELLLKKIAE